MIPKYVSFAVTLCATLLLCATLIGTGAMAVEEPSFKSILHEGAFEIRDYPALIAAEVTVSGDQKEAASKGFRLLAGYIFGGNKRRQGIAMTAPVAQIPAGGQAPAREQTPVGEKIAMTAPVTQFQSAGKWVVRFTMPSGYSLETLPEPDDPQVHLRALAPTRFAVIQFSGLARKDDVAAKTVELGGFIKSHHLQTIGPASLAQYNPPWTLWFMRRNEVMIPVAP